MIVESGFSRMIVESGFNRMIVESGFSRMIVESGFSRIPRARSGAVVAVPWRVISLHPQPLRGFDYLGEHRYFLTFCTCWRRPLFTAPERVDVARTQILRAATDEKFELIAYCFMPDHVHLLAAGWQPTSNCRRFITRAKQFSGYHYQRAFNERLWQRYGYEHVLRASEDVFNIARYILENPIRTGLVQSVHDYPYLGSTLYTIDQIVDSLHTSDKFGGQSG